MVRVATVKVKSLSIGHEGLGGDKIRVSLLKIAPGKDPQFFCLDLYEQDARRLYVGQSYALELKELGDTK